MLAYVQYFGSAITIVYGKPKFVRIFGTNHQQIFSNIHSNKYIPINVALQYNQEQEPENVQNSSMLQI
jgi:hypothetical protein